LAQRAHAEALVIGEMQRRQKEAADRQQQLERITWGLSQLGLEVTAQDDPCEVDGLWFTASRNGHLLVLLACPECGDRFDRRAVHSLEQLGSQIAHYGEDLQGHTVCETCTDRHEQEDRELLPQRIPPPTAEDQLLAALDCLLRERVRELLG
jgi:hypothetical protein